MSTPDLLLGDKQITEGLDARGQRIAEMLAPSKRLDTP